MLDFQKRKKKNPERNKKKRKITPIEMLLHNDPAQEVSKECSGQPHHNVPQDNGKYLYLILLVQQSKQHIFC